MRAFVRGTVSPAIHLLALGLTVATVGAGVAACADSIHLDPPGGTGGKGSTTTHGTGGGGSTECRSNPDCAYPTPVCDTVADKCVECLVLSDCAGKPGTVCSLGACSCAVAKGDAPLTFCPADGAAGPRCVDTQTSSSDCGGCGHGCFGGCTAGKCADAWSKITTVGAPSPRSHHVAVWTGSRMFVWGGTAAGGPTSTGGLYDPATDTWSPVSGVNAPSARSDATAVWDPVENVVIVWGGLGPGSAELGTGAMYHPSTDTWTTIKTDSAPSPRHAHTAVWASFDTPFLSAVTHGVIVWGGDNKGSHLGDGMVLDTSTNSWAGPIDTSTAPSARREHTAVWDDQSHQMIVFGGYGVVGAMDDYLGDGAAFLPGTNQWSPLGLPGTPSPRAGHAAVWDTTGHAMYVMGGTNGTTFFGEVDRYASGAWQSQAAAATPEGRDGHTAVWVDKIASMIVFGGQNGSGLLATGWSAGSALTWSPIPTAPAARAHHTAVTDGTIMLIWGGDGAGGLLGDGAIYTP